MNLEVFLSEFFVIYYSNRDLCILNKSWYFQSVTEGGVVCDRDRDSWYSLQSLAVFSESVAFKLLKLAAVWQFKQLVSNFGEIIQIETILDVICYAFNRKTL